MGNLEVPFTFCSSSIHRNLEIHNAYRNPFPFWIYSQVCKLGLFSDLSEPSQDKPFLRKPLMAHKEGGDFEFLSGFSSKLKEFPRVMGFVSSGGKKGKRGESNFYEKQRSRYTARGKKEGNMILAKAKCSRRDAIHGSYRTASQDPIPSFATPIFHTSSPPFERLFILKSPV